MKKEVNDFVGKKVLVNLGLSVKVEVKILDVKNTYGRTRYLITPISGTGEMWVETVYLIEKK